MASPVTAGVVGQLIEYCRAQGLSYCPTDGEFWPSSAKALLMHAAQDFGNTGPDYQWGYGRIDADASAGLLTNSGSNYADLRQDQITNNDEIDTYQITISGSPAQLKVSLAWDDEAATMQALTKLVNDLDLVLVSPGGATYRPYILDPNNPSNPATTGADHINNQEQAVVSSPANGTWTIRVIGTAVPAGPQDYSIIFPSAYNTAPGQTPGVTPVPTPTPNPSYCAEAITNGTFETGNPPSNWTMSGSAARSNTYAHAGTYSMRAGGTTDGTFYQDVTVPSGTYCGAIGFWYRMQTSETSHPYDFLDVEIRNTSDTALTTLLSSDDSKTNGTWIQASFPIGQGYAGRTLRLHFSADVDTSVNTYWYVDDVSFYRCTWPPDYVRLARFEARPEGAAIHVEWETVTEIDNLGFNLYRADAPDGPYAKLNRELIPSQAPGSPVGAVYVWLDVTVQIGRTYYYRLEDVDIHGNTTLHGPVRVKAGPTLRVKP